MPDTTDRTLWDIFPGTTQMAQTMRARDWSATPLGDPRLWPDALKIPLRMILTSRFEMWLGWGDDLCFFYNDAYIPTLGLKHPAMLGRPFREVWKEVYDDVADQVERVRAGEASWNNALLLLLERNGYPEETYHSFSYSPLFSATGQVDGLLCVVSEETARVIGERRMETLRHLGAALGNARNPAAVRAAVDATFAGNKRDFPFAVLQLAGDNAGEALFRPPRRPRGAESTTARLSISQRTFPGLPETGRIRRPRRWRSPFTGKAMRRRVGCWWGSIPIGATIANSSRSSA